MQGARNIGNITIIYLYKT